MPIDRLLLYIGSVLSVCGLILAYNSGCYRHQNQWTEIQEISSTHCFISDQDEKFIMTVFSKCGKPLYILDARFNAWKYENEDYSFSGAFDCCLFPVDRNETTYQNLFQNVKNATRDWETDTRFLGDEIIGLGLAEARSSRSIVQRCKVRGMYIKIEINNVIVDSGKNIKSLRFKIMFINDPTASSEISDEEVLDYPNCRGTTS